MCSYQPAPTVATSRLTLRTPRIEDAVAIAAQCADFDVARMTTRMPFPYGFEDAAGFLARMEAADPDKDRVFVLDHPKHGVIGAVGLHTAERHPELGYWVGRDHWGLGYATEAVRGALAWAKDAWRKKVVTAGHFADNPASGAVLVKTGFLYTGDVELKHSLSRGEEVPTKMMVWIA